MKFYTFRGIVNNTIGGSRGGAPPHGSRFFRFDMQNFRNVAASGVHGPPYEVHAPLREILDPPLNTDFVVVKRIEVIAKLECKEYRVYQDVRLDAVM